MLSSSTKKAQSISTVCCWRGLQAVFVLVSLLWLSPRPSMFWQREAVQLLITHKRLSHQQPMALMHSLLRWIGHIAFPCEAKGLHAITFTPYPSTQRVIVNYDRTSSNSVQWYSARQKEHLASVIIIKSNLGKRFSKCGTSHPSHMLTCNISKMALAYNFL